MITAKTKAVLQSLIICTFFLSAILIVIGIHWEANDDPAFAWLLSRVDNSWSPFQGVLFGKVIHGLYSIMPSVEWWLIATLFAIYFSGIAIVYVIQSSFPKQKASYLSLIMLVLMWFMALRSMNFTRTAAILSTAGILLIANGIFVKKIKKGMCEYCIGIFLLLWGRSVRNDCAYLAVLFLAIIALVYTIRLQNLKRIFTKKNVCRYVQFLIVPVVLITASVLNSSLLTEEQKNYIEYNKVRSEIQDYSKRFKWDLRYEEAGMSEREFQLFCSWFQEDTEEYTLEKLKDILEFANKTTSINDMFALFKRAVFPDVQFTIIVVTLIMCLMFWSRFERIFEIVLPFIALLGISLYLVASGRFPERVYESLVFMMLCTSLYMLSKKKKNNPFTKGFQIKKILKKFSYILPSAVMVIAVAMMFYVMSMSVEKNETIFSSIEAKLEKRESTLDIIDQDADNIYLIPVGYAPASLNNDFGIWEARPRDYCENFFYLGGWDVAHPYYRSLQENLNITNPVKALFEKDNVYSVYCNYLTEYLQEHYGQDIAVSCVREYNNSSIVKYSRYVDNTTFAVTQDISVTVEILEYREKNNVNTTYIAGVLQGNFSDINYLFCNIEYGAIARTYQLNINRDGTFNAYMYETPLGIDLSAVNYSFWGKNESGFNIKIEI